MTPRVRSEVYRCESQADERVHGLFDERNRSVRVLISRGKPCGHPAWADAAGEHAPVQYSGVRERRPIAGNIGRTASAPGVPRDEDVRVIDDETCVRTHPVDAAHGVDEIRRHVSGLITHLPSEQARHAAARVWSDYREASGSGDIIECEDEMLTQATQRRSGIVQQQYRLTLPNTSL